MASPLDQKALPERAVRWMRMLWVVMAPLVLLGTWVAYFFVIEPIKEPFLEVVGVFATLVLLGGAVAMIWVAARFTSMLVGWLVWTGCPECGGRARLRRVRRGGLAYYTVVRCGGCGETYENFFFWYGQPH